MKKLFLALVAPLAMLASGCTILENPSAAPAPLEQTAVDEKALVLALETFDTVLSAVDILIEAGHIVPGTDRALRIADAVDSAKGWLQVASHAQRTGSTASYLEAIENARAAIAGIKAQLG